MSRCLELYISIKDVKLIDMMLIVKKKIKQCDSVLDHLGTILIKQPKALVFSFDSKAL